MDRAWRWCIARTLRDLRLSVRRGRPITRPNLERLFARRWASVAGERSVADESDHFMADRGRRLLRRRYRRAHAAR